MNMLSWANTLSHYMLTHMPTSKFITHTQVMHTVVTKLIELLCHGTKKPSCKDAAWGRKIFSSKKA